MSTRPAERPLEIPALPGFVWAPRFFINGGLSVGRASWDGFRSRVAHELPIVDDLLAKGTKLDAIYALRAKELAKDAAAFDIYRAGMVEPRTRAAVANGRASANIR
jgi:hypothetical protein